MTEEADTRLQIAELTRAIEAFRAADYLCEGERQELAALRAELLALAGPPLSPDQLLALRDCWTTPPELARNLVREFRLTLDVAADATNGVTHYFCGGDGLKQKWGVPAWCNPPYSDILPWAEKALESRSSTVLLLPARTASPWFRLLVTNTRVSWWTFKGRVKFNSPHVQIPQSSPRHDSLLFYVHPYRGQGFLGVRDPKTGEILERANQP